MMKIMKCPYCKTEIIDTKNQYNVTYEDGTVIYYCSWECRGQDPLVQKLTHESRTKLKHQLDFLDKKIKSYPKA